MTLQIENVTELLTKEGVTVIGLLLSICALLIWDKVRQEKRYSLLLDKYEKEQEDNKTILIDLVHKSILATEQNTNAINNIRDVYRKN
jgi:hypothetical protein